MLLYASLSLSITSVVAGLALVVIMLQDAPYNNHQETLKKGLLLVRLINYMAHLRPHSKVKLGEGKEGKKEEDSVGLGLCFYWD